MKRLTLAASTLAAVAALALPTTASAGFVWNEHAPGAGDVLATAQATYDSSFNTLNGINGALMNITPVNSPDPVYEVDLFRIRIDDPANFTATTLGDLDLALYLFDASGFGVFMSDDNPFPNPTLPALPAPNVAGIYYLAVALFGYGAEDASASPMFDFTGSPVEAGTGAGPLAQWTPSFFGDGPLFNYEIVLTGATNSDIPEPGSAALLLAAGLGAWLSRRRPNAKAPTVAA